MILSDRTIRQMLSDHSLVISPLTEDQIQPASVDVRLGNTFSVVEDSSSGILTLAHEISYKAITADTYLLLPGQFVLATTMEYFELPDDLTAFVEGGVLWGGWDCLSRMQAGWIRASAERSLWNCSMPIAAP